MSVSICDWAGLEFVVPMLSDLNVASISSTLIGMTISLCMSSAASGVKIGTSMVLL